MNPLVVHCKQSDYHVYIGRPSIWGNPYSHVRGAGLIYVPTREEAIRLFEIYLLGHDNLVKRAKRQLKGKILGCWCAPLPCHGEVLARIANE